MEKTSAVLIGFLATLALTASSAYAAQIDVSVDRHLVAPGDSITVTGSITDDDGNPGVFDYKVAAVAPGRNDGGERIVICDSGNMTTGDDGMVSFECEIPTLEELEEMGVRNAAERSVIPIKGGIVTQDPETGNVSKRSGRAMIVNTDKIRDRMQHILDSLDRFIEHAESVIDRCEQAAANNSNLTDRCATISDRMQDRIDRANEAKDRINEALENLDDLDEFTIDELRRSFADFRSGAHDFRAAIDEFKSRVMDAAGRINETAVREVVGEIRDRLADRRDHRMGQTDSNESEAMTVTEEVDVETTEADSA